MGKANDIRKAAKKRRQALSTIAGTPLLSWHPCAYVFGRAQGWRAEINSEQSIRISNEKDGNDGYCTR